MLRNSLILLLFLFAFSACKKKLSPTPDASSYRDIPNKYAEGFSIREHDGYKEIVVFSPWKKNEIYARYYLVNAAKQKTPADGQKILVPITSIAATSVTHFEFLRLIGEINSISAVCSPRFIYNQQIVSRVKAGMIADIGDALNLNIEKTLMAKPSVIMMSGYNQNDSYSQRIKQAGIPVLLNLEWMETSLLARSEWIKFVAAFYNKSARADSIFEVVDKSYNQLKELAKNAKTHPFLMAGNSFRGTWYMPAGKSYMAKMYADAGATYFYANDSTSGSLALNFETVLKNFHTADIWINCNFKSLEALAASDRKHSLFRPFVRKQVYSFNKRLLPNTANDFWESAVARPDSLLLDVIAILHPEMFRGYSYVYAQKLE